MSPEALAKRLQDVEKKIDSADALQRVHLIQQRRDLEQRLAAANEQNGDDLATLEEAFVEVAAEYGSRKGIDYATWREAGVPADVLQRAGVHWSRR